MAIFLQRNIVGLRAVHCHFFSSRKPGVVVNRMSDSELGLWLLQQRLSFLFSILSGLVYERATYAGAKHADDYKSWGEFSAYFKVSTSIVVGNNEISVPARNDHRQ